MPTIEIVSIDCPEVPKLPVYSSFAFIAETTLTSHRDLFQSVFDGSSGVIVHLGNKRFEGKGDGYWFAGMLMDWDDNDALVFRPEVRAAVADLMTRLIIASSRHRLTFSSDYQFGGERQQGAVELSDFFTLHDRRMLRYNSLWQVYLETNSNLEAVNQLRAEGA